MTSEPSSDSPDTAAPSSCKPSVGPGTTETITFSRSAYRCRNGRCPLSDNRVADKAIAAAEFRFYQMLGGFANRAQLGAQPVDHDVDRPVGGRPMLPVEGFGKREAGLDLPRVGGEMG